jgi:hypothetical protein
MVGGAARGGAGRQRGSGAAGGPAEVRNVADEWHSDGSGTRRGIISDGYDNSLGDFGNACTTYRGRLGKKRKKKARAKAASLRYSGFRIESNYPIISDYV